MLYSEWCQRLVSKAERYEERAAALRRIAAKPECDATLFMASETNDDADGLELAESLVRNGVPDFSSHATTAACDTVGDAADAAFVGSKVLESLILLFDGDITGDAAALSQLMEHARIYQSKLAELSDRMSGLAAQHGANLSLRLGDNL